MTGEAGIVEDDSIGTDLGLFLSTLLLQRKKSIDRESQENTAFLAPDTNMENVRAGSCSGPFSNTILKHEKRLIRKCSD